MQSTVGGRGRRPGLLLFFTLALFFPQAAAQAADRSPVGYAQAVTYRMTASVRLPGSVESRKVSTVASEVAGLVVEIPVREGDRVEAGETLARLREKELKLRREEAVAQLQEDKARLSFAEVNYERMQDLYEGAVVSRQELDDAKFEYSAWQGRVQRLEAQIDRLTDQLERSVIRAPFNGVIVEKYAEVGEWVGEGGSIVEVLSLDDLEVRVDVPERYFGDLRRDAFATVEFEALREVRLRARIVSIIPRADPRARTFPIRIKLPARERRVGAGMVAQVALPVGDVYQAVLVPKDAVLTDSVRPRVFLIRDNDTAVPVDVEMGRGVGAWIEVRGDVQPGDRVIVRGNERLRPGESVQPKREEYRRP